MQTVFIVLGVVVVFAALLELVPDPPAKYRDLDTPAIRGGVELLYVRGLDGGYLQFEADQFPTGFRLYKKIHALGDIELQINIPRETLESVGVDSAASVLKSFGCTIEYGGSQDQGGGALLASCGPDLPHAVAIIEAVLRNILKVDPGTDAIMYAMKIHRSVWAHPGLPEQPEWFI